MSDTPAPNPDAASDSDDQPLVCPKCNSPMARIRAAGVTVDRCRSCGGLWLDALEKEKIVATPGAAAAVDTGPAATGKRTDATHKIKCPRDHAQMIHMHDPEQPHVGYESCTVCGGVFLDAGELKDLGHLSLRERLRGIFHRSTRRRD